MMIKIFLNEKSKQIFDLISIKLKNKTKIIAIEEENI
jgi:hypothetical protein